MNFDIMGWIGYRLNPPKPTNWQERAELAEQYLFQLVDKLLEERTAGERYYQKMEDYYKGKLRDAHRTNKTRPQRELACPRCTDDALVC